MRLTEPELMSQLRQHGVGRLAEVRAVVMESTGSVSVLSGAETPDAALLLGVRGADLVPTAAPTEPPSSGGG